MHCELESTHRSEWRRRILDSTTPLPGAERYDNHRPLRVPGRFDNWRLLDFLREYHPHVDLAEWSEILGAGHIRDHNRALPSGAIVRGGQELIHLIPDCVEPDVSNDLGLIWEDASLLAVWKPAPLPVHPCGRFCRNTLIHFLRNAFPGTRFRLAHRLDADTTGLQLLTKTDEAAVGMQRQFEERTIEKVYLAEVDPAPQDDEFTVKTAISRRPSRAGSRRASSDDTASKGLAARTSFRVIERRDDSRALVEARPLTGRTHQIRLHLRVNGTSVVGDHAYGRDLDPADAFTMDEPTLHLHSSSLKIRHPVSGEDLTLTAEAPAWAATTALETDR